METQTESASPENKPASRWRKWLLLLVVAVVFYGLSFGFVVRLEAQGRLKKHRRTSKTFSIIYSPLVWLHHNTPLRKPIEHYVRLWLPPAEKNN